MNDFKIDQSCRDEVEKALSAFETQVCGLPVLQQIVAPPYLTMSLEDIRKKSTRELSEAVFELRKYAFYIQQTINRLRAWERWGKSKSDQIAASLILDVDKSFGWNQQELMARNNHELCRQLNAFLNKVRMQIERLYGVPENVRYIADSIKDIRFAYMQQDKDNG